MYELNQQNSFPAPLGMYLQAAFDDSWSRAPGPSLYRMAELYGAKEAHVYDEFAGLGLPDFGIEYTHDRRSSTILTEEEWRQSDYFIVGPDGRELEYEKLKNREGVVYEEVARIIADRRRKELRNQEIMSRSPSGLGRGALGLAAGFVAQAVDPVNIFASLIPAVRGAMYLSTAVKLTKTTKLLAGSTSASRAIRGAIDGLAGNLIVEPAVYMAAVQEQSDYGWEDTAFALGAGTVLGAGLSTIGGKILDISFPSKKDNDAFLSKSLNDVTEGNPVDVSPIYKASDIEQALRAKKPSLENMLKEHKLKMSPEEIKLRQEFDATTRKYDLYDENGRVIVDPEIRRAKIAANKVDPNNFRTVEEYHAKLKETISSLPLEGVPTRQMDRFGVVIDKKDPFSVGTEIFDPVERQRIIEEDLIPQEWASAQRVMPLAEAHERLKTLRDELLKKQEGEPLAVLTARAIDTMELAENPVKTVTYVQEEMKTMREVYAARAKKARFEDKSPDPFAEQMARDVKDLEDDFNRQLLATDTHIRMLANALLVERSEAAYNKVFMDLVKLGVSQSDILIFRGSLLSASSKIRQATGGHVTAIDVDRIISDIAAINKQFLAADVRGKMLTNEAIIRFQSYASKFDQTPKGQLLAMEAYLVGMFKGFEGERVSVDAVWKQLDYEFSGKLSDALNRIDPNGVIRKGKAGKEFHKDLATELFELRPGGNRGVTKNTIAKQIAEVVGEMYDDTIARMNKAGAMINKLDGYIVKQIHVAERVRNAGLTQWKKDIIDKLDLEKTFDEVKIVDPAAVSPTDLVRLEQKRMEEIDGVLDEIYNAIVFNKYIGFDNYSSIPVKDNFGARVSSKRHLHFKDPESFVAYNESYGPANILDMIMGEFSRRARTIAVMEKLGPVPRHTVDRIMGDLSTRYKGNEKFAKMAKKKGSMFSSYMDVLTGDGMIPENITIAKVAQGVRNMQAMSKLGGIVFAAIGDMPHGAKTLHWVGDEYLTSFGRIFGNIFHKFKGKERKQFAELLGAGLDGWRGEIVSRFYAVDGPQGFMAKAVPKFFKWAGIEPWTDVHKSGIAQAVCRLYGQFSDLPFDKLNARARRTFKSYGISPEDWDVMRSAGKFQVEGATYISPSQIMKSNETVGRKLHLLVVDVVNQGVLTPGTKERAKMLSMWGNPWIAKPGTILGEVIRAMMLFKSWSMSVMYKAWARDFRGALTTEEKLLVIPHYAIVMTLFGYAAQMTKDAFRGKSPRDPEEPGTWAKAFAVGGAGALLGDIVNSTMSKWGASVTQPALGPVAGSIENLSKPMLHIIRGEWDKVGPSALHAITGEMPFLNLIYARWAFDYLLFYGLHEAMNPGYLRKLENNARENHKQRYWLRPVKYAVRYD